MNRRVLLVLSSALLAACAATQPAAPPEPSPEEQVERAQQLAASGKPRAALDLYLEVLKKYPNDPAAFDARYGMAKLRLDPDSPLCDYRLALVNFDRLVAKYGKSGDARLEDVEAWRAALRKLERCEVQGAKLSRDADRLRALEADMQKLRDVDLEVGK